MIETWGFGIKFWGVKNQVVTEASCHAPSFQRTDQFRLIFNSLKLGEGKQNIENSGDKYWSLFAKIFRTKDWNTCHFSNTHNRSFPNSK